MEEKIYFISGLGADKRVFVNLKINNPLQKYIEWVPPQKKESIQQYCNRLIDQIDLTAEVILVGVSFGGIVAQEISKIIAVKKLIIISSIKNEKEMDWKLQWIRKSRIYQWFPVFVLKGLNKLTAGYYFGTTSKEEHRLLLKIIEETDPLFMIWAIDQLMHWRITTSNSILHIHGTKDKIFPINTIKDATQVLNGGHFMVLNKSEEVSYLINSYLSGAQD